MTTAVPDDAGAHGGEVSTTSARRPLPRADVASVVDFAVLTAVEPAVGAAAVRDTLLVLASRPNPAPAALEPLVVLSHARAEVWRQLRARGIHHDTAPEVRIDAEPLHALTPAERTALYCFTRRGMRAEDVGYVMDVAPRTAMKLRRQAHVAFVRAVTALALAMDLTPCPVRDQLAARGAGMLSRRDIDALTMHAAECAICVDWLRRADRNAVTGYGALPAPSDHEINVVVADLMRAGDEERTRVVRRAGALRRDGRPPRAPMLDADPRVWVKRAALLGGVSVFLVIVGVLSLAH